jgi:hypothetical protein
MKRSSKFLLAAVGVSGSVVALQAVPAAKAGTAPTPPRRSAAPFISMHASARAAQLGPYPDFVDQLPQGYTGPRFKLSQAYPQSAPAGPRPWEAFDFKTQREQYLNAVREYCYQGNIQVDFRGEVNPVRRWYGVPWMHVGANAREGIHGLTRERLTPPRVLAPTQTTAVQNWAVAYYNDVGGFTIGRVWADPERPRPELSQFRNGTVVCKLLFTAATAQQVPWLAGSVEWRANIHQTNSTQSPKQIRPILLLQMDVAVRDSRANTTTGWVFGTFVYDRSAQGNPWQKMRPVGLMWGNDPGITPSMVNAGARLRESSISPDRPAPTAALLGWAGRLNGPVDNPESACSSCHSLAQHPRGSPMVPSGPEQARLPWFRNLRGDQPFDAGRVPLDYSLQMAVALRNYFDSGLNPDLSPEAAFKAAPMRPGVEIERFARPGTRGRRP